MLDALCWQVRGVTLAENGVNRFRGMLLVFACMALPAAAQAQQTVNFDNLSSCGGGLVLPALYAGFSWSNVYCLDGVNYQFPSGYVNGVVSTNNVAYNGFGNSSSFSSANPFTFNSGYFTAAWRNGLQVNIIGRLNSAQIFSTTLSLNISGPTFVTLNWAGIDEVDFSALGGSNPGLRGDGTHFVMDDLLFNDVQQVPVEVTPEPATLLLLGSGLAGIGGFVRRRRQKDTED
jgi:hypothetical protein